MSHVHISLPGVIDAPSEASWDDLVLPDRCIQGLKEYVGWATHRDQVELEWGGRIAGGPIALFSGPPGTGKTFASNVLGNILELDLYRVDPGSLVRKHIGETEKNLNALFASVANEPVLLVFDEADALFRKRSDVDNANDRYANLELNYLLSRLERHPGPSVLTSNSKERFDPGLMGRLQFVIDFPLPDAAARSRLWRLHLPARAPIDRDVDTDNLAEELELTGGQIRNAALHAAFLAAGESSSITRKHIIAAGRAELVKTDNS